jgi:hypothetical protein
MAAARYGRWTNDRNAVPAMEEVSSDPPASKSLMPSPVKLACPVTGPKKTAVQVGVLKRNSLPAFMVTGSKKVAMALPVMITLLPALQVTAP